jgi:hypothetical protein
VRFRAVVADCFYGGNPASPRPWVPQERRSCWPSSPTRVPGRRPRPPHTPVEAAGELGWRGPNRPGQWRRIQRRFRDGHTETWWAADATLGGLALTAGCGGWWPPPTRPACRGTQHLVLADQPAPSRQPPHPAGRPCRHRAPVRAPQLGRAGLQAGQRRAGLGRLSGQKQPSDPPALDLGLLRVLLLLAGLPRRALRPTGTARPAASGAKATGHRRRSRRQQLVIDGVAGGVGLADPMDRAAALLAVVVTNTAAPTAATAA